MQPIITVVITSLNSLQTSPLRREAGSITLRILPIRLEARGRNRDDTKQYGRPGRVARNNSILTFSCFVSVLWIIRVQ